MRDIVKFEAGEEFHVWFPSNAPPIITRGVEDGTFSDAMWFVWHEDPIERIASSDGAITFVSEALEVAADLRIERVCIVCRDRNKIQLPPLLLDNIREVIRNHISNLDGIRYRIVHI